MTCNEAHSAVVLDIGGVHIDDAPANVAGARAAGFGQAIRFTNGESLLAQLKSLEFL
jgi:hypothetical protein